MRDLSNKTIIITGAVGGIGQAVATLLDARGANLVLTDISDTRLDTLDQRLGNRHYTVAADLSTEAGRQKLVGFCDELMHPPHMLINIAGINLFSKIADYSDEQLSRMITINLTTQIALCRDFLPLLMQQKQADIVNVGSILGSIGMPGYSVYCATKFGLRGFTEALRRELLDTTVQVRYFAPRATQTALNDSRVVSMNEALGNAMDSPDQVAQELVKFIEGKAKRAYLGWPEKLFVRINSVFPNVVDKSFHKQLTTIKRYL